MVVSDVIGGEWSVNIANTVISSFYSLRNVVEFETAVVGVQHVRYVLIDTAFG